jgi:hypothetical protein
MKGLVVLIALMIGILEMHSVNAKVEQYLTHRQEAGVSHNMLEQTIP